MKEDANEEGRENKNKVGGKGEIAIVCHLRRNEVMRGRIRMSEGKIRNVGMKVKEGHRAQETK